MCEIIKHFSDETSSGEYQRELTKLFRVDFAARISLTSDFEWYRILEQELKEKYTNELKSGLLIELARQDTNLWDRILRNIHNATIIIIDLTQHLRVYKSNISYICCTN